MQYMLMDCHLWVDHAPVLAREVHVLLAHALDGGGDGLAHSILGFLDLELRSIRILQVLDHEA